MIGKEKPRKPWQIDRHKGADGARRERHDKGKQHRGLCRPFWPKNVQKKHEKAGNGHCQSEGFPRKLSVTITAFDNRKHNLSTRALFNFRYALI
jgi:hypothetical protein